MSLSDTQAKVSHWENIRAWRDVASPCLGKFSVIVLMEDEMRMI